MRGAVTSHDGHILLREDRSTRAQNWASGRGAFTFWQEKKLKGSPVVFSVATAIVEGRRRSWTGGKGCPLDPFDATDEPSGCSPSQAAIRRTIWLSSTTSSESSRIHVVSTHRRPSSAKRAASEKNPCWRRSTWTRVKCGRRPLWSRCAWLSWTAFPTNISLSPWSSVTKKHRRCRGERAR